MSKAVFAGSFDPFTKGHLEVVQHFLPLFDEIIILISENPNKKGWLTVSHRAILIQKVLEAHNMQGKVKVDYPRYARSTVEYAVQNKAEYLIRGLRSNDGTLPELGYECNLDLVNQTIDPTIKTIYMITAHPELSSSNVRELVKLYGVDFMGLQHYLTSEAITYLQSSNILEIY